MYMYVCHVTCMKKTIGSIVKLVRWDSPSDSDCRYWTSIPSSRVASRWPFVLLAKKEDERCPSFFLNNPVVNSALQCLTECMK